MNDYDLVRGTYDFWVRWSDLGEFGDMSFEMLKPILVS